ncbi:hypothetical protein IFM89_016389 [Coptis chinensis]|uniref:Uncharacterized protein n=1 Tax=Coptis chinensis TaxID=261450 RepID=A0A835LIW6_9MAGN|nr:hypothetical protein IFM89_016389 [Coptis chinensis]
MMFIACSCPVRGELTKFINHCNEVKFAAAANKEGGQLSIVKPPPPDESTSGANKKETQSITDSSKRLPSST